MLKSKIQKNIYSQRQLKVGELVKKSLVEFFYKDSIHDPDLINTSITITQVTLSPDLKQATAYVMPLGGNNSEEIVTALNRNSKYIRGQIAANLSLKYTPYIINKEDASFEYASNIDRLLDKISNH